MLLPNNMTPSSFRSPLRLVVLGWTFLLPSCVQAFVIPAPASSRLSSSTRIRSTVHDRAVSRQALGTISKISSSRSSSTGNSNTALPAIWKGDNDSLGFVRRTIRRVVGSAAGWVTSSWSSIIIRRRKPIPIDEPIQDAQPDSGVASNPQDKVSETGAFASVAAQAMPTTSESSSTESSSSSMTVSSTATTRFATAPAGVDFSGHWKPVVTPAFLRAYDEYLKNCGEGIFFRKALLTAIQFSKEIYHHHGAELTIQGTTTIGTNRGWERTLVASGRERGDGNDNHGQDSNFFEPIYTTFADPDGDMVTVEAWWEDDHSNDDDHDDTTTTTTKPRPNSQHKSWLRGKPRVQGGEFETTRYLDAHNPNTLYCEAAFHPANGSQLKPASVLWTFQKIQ